MFDYENEGCLQVQFSKAAKQYPDRVAVVDGFGYEITYKQLDYWTDILAAYLRQQALGEDRCAIIYMEKCLPYVVAYIAILKAGGAYLPLDISYTQNLIEDILNEAEPYAIITRSNLRNNIPSTYSNTIICLDDHDDDECIRSSEFISREKQTSEFNQIANNDANNSQTNTINNSRRRLTSSTIEPDISFGQMEWKKWLQKLHDEGLVITHLPIDTGLDRLAFIVYSSGTTGKPKGISVPHRAPVFSYLWRHIYYPYDDKLEGEREACNIFFVWELLRPLLRGQTMHIIPDDVIYDPHCLLRFLLQRSINRMLFTPSLLEAVLDLKDVSLLEAAFKSFKQIWLCGEVVTSSLMERCIKLLPSTVQIINLYSISECHDVAAADLTEYFANKSDMKTRKFCPVGKLLPGVQVLILDENLDSQPVGVSGEIYVAGPTLARGYVKRPDLNKQKFLSIPEKVLAVELLKNATTSGGGGDGEWPKMYRTGDWGYLLSDGSIEICGRCDSMVKIRGYSVEIHAVESMLLSLEGINACVVLTHGAEGEDKRLVAYIVPANSLITKKNIREQLKRRLPFYMIPNYFVFIKEIPILAASGKLNKKALPELNLHDHSIEPEFMPQTETEIKLSILWKQILQLKQIDIQESFFDLGGHSLLATKLLNIINREFHSELSVKDLFKYPTISNLSKVLDKRQQNENVEEDAKDLLIEVQNHDQPQSIDLDIQLRAFWRFSTYNEARWQKGCVLLTGATGFLGAFLLKDLLLSTQCQIFCLVRNSDDGLDAKIRIRDTLIQYEILSNETNDEAQTTLHQMFDQRVSVVRGDITLVQFGLAPEDYAYLCTEIDFVFHSAAYVNLVYPYDALYSPNVLGTANIILFSAQSKVKPLHYVSTDAVFPHGIRLGREDADMSLFSSRLTDGYAQSKWVAEQLVMKAIQRGQPAVIYRLGNQSGDRSNAAWNPADFTLLMLRSMLSSGFGPDLSQWKLEMTPVDFTSQVIVQLSQMVARVAGKVFHLTQANPINVSLLYEWLSLYGYPLKLVSFSDWLTKLSKSTVDHELKAYRLCLDMTNGDADYFGRLSTFEQHNTREILQHLNWTYPPVDGSLLRLYLASLARRKLIPSPSTNIVRSISCDAMNCLTNKVVIVTGASSGIGQAVALRLGSFGCLLGLAARRKDELERTRTAIIASGGRALSVVTDVSQYDEVTQLVKKTESAFGPVDILVHCAGVMYYTLMKKVQREEWDRTIDINCRGTTNMLGSILESFRTRPGSRGHLVFLSSDAGLTPFPGLAVYTASKYFVQGVCKATRKELAADENMKNIRITLIQPGDVRTPLQDISSNDKEAVQMYGAPEGVKMLEAEDVAGAVVYALTQPEYVAINDILIEPRQLPT